MSTSNAPNRDALYAAIASGMLIASAMASVAQAKVYWSDPRSRNIERMDLDGSNREVIVSGLADVGRIDCDPMAGKIYWCDPAASTGRLQRANLDGTSVETIIPPSFFDLRGPAGIAVDPIGGKVYFSAAQRVPLPQLPYDTVFRANLDGTNIEPLFSRFDPLGRPEWIDLDRVNSKVYFVDGGNVKRSNFDGSGLETLVGRVSANDVGVDPVAGKFYWSDYPSGPRQDPIESPARTSTARTSKTS